MKSSTVHIVTALFSTLPSGYGYTWPDNRYDLMEEFMFLPNDAYDSPGFADNVTPCNSASFGGARQTAAEWVRTAYHDMATANVEAGTGGIDASIQYETLRAENVGPAFNNTLTTLLDFYSPETSMADLIALAVYAAVDSCGGPQIPVRYGRKDAAGPGPSGVPQPQQSAKQFQQSFKAQGFNTTDMIALVACGHTLGGVHGADFPTIVGKREPRNENPHFDATDTFDNKIVTEYLDGTTTDPLVRGHDGTMNSDLKVFTVDGNATMKTLLNTNTFMSRCESVLERMINTVPHGVVLSQPITPIPMKPTNLDLSIGLSGNLKFTGDLRLLTNNMDDKVSITITDRVGKNFGTFNVPIQPAQDSLIGGKHAKFVFYTMDITIPWNRGISSFTVIQKTAKGQTTLYNNGGQGFKYQDKVLFLTQQSCSNGDGSTANLTVTAAIRQSRVNEPLSLDLTLPIVQSNSLVPKFAKTSTRMKALKNKDLVKYGYSLYQTTYSFVNTSPTSARFNITSGTGENQIRVAGSEFALNSGCAKLT